MNFWERALGGQKQHPDPPPSQGTAWWQTPASGHLQPPTPPQAVPGADSGASFTYQQLKAMRADQMSQDQMEQLAVYELQGDKYNHACPNCGSDDFIPAGTRVNNQRMPVDKCFHCGSAGALASSPEPAPGGSTGRSGRATRQTASGGQGNYGHHVSQLPSQYLPRS